MVLPQFRTKKWNHFSWNCFGEPRDGHGRWTTGGDSAAPRDDQAAPPLVFRRPSSPFSGAGSGTAHVELVGSRRYRGKDMRFVARILGITEDQFGNVIHRIKPHASLGGADDLEFDLENGDVYFNNENIDNAYN